VARGYPDGGQGWQGRGVPGVARVGQAAAQVDVTPRDVALRDEDRFTLRDAIAMLDREARHAVLTRGAQPSRRVAGQGGGPPTWRVGTPSTPIALPGCAVPLSVVIRP